MNLVVDIQQILMNMLIKKKSNFSPLSTSHICFLLLREVRRKQKEEYDNLRVELLKFKKDKLGTGNEEQVIFYFN